MATFSVEPLTTVWSSRWSSSSSRSTLSRVPSRWYPSAEHEMFWPNRLLGRGSGCWSCWEMRHEEIECSCDSAVDCCPASWLGGCRDYRHCFPSFCLALHEGSATVLGICEWHV